MCFEKEYYIMQDQTSRLFKEVKYEAIKNNEFRLTEALMVMPVFFNDLDETNPEFLSMIEEYFEENPDGLKTEELMFCLNYDRYSFVKEDVRYLSISETELHNPDNFNYDQNKVSQSLNHYFFLRILRLEGIKFLKKYTSS